MQVILRLSKKERLQGIPLRRQQKYCKLLTINFLILYILKDSYCGVGIKFIHEYLEQQLTFGFFSVAPTVSLELGRMVNPEDLEEGDDIYFSCSINANPPAYKLTWWHNVSS